MAIPTLVGHVDAYGTGTSARVLTPHASTIVGDFMVAVFAANVQTITPPAGWSTVAMGTGAAAFADTGTLRTQVFYKFRATAETTYSFTIGASATDTHTIITYRGVDPALTNFAKGPLGPRVTSTIGGGSITGTGTSTTNVAPALTTTQADVEVITISTERTTVTEAAITSISGATADFFVIQNGSTGLETIHISHQDMASAGTTSAVTLTYPQTQPNNGFAFQLEIPSVPGTGFSGTANFAGTGTLTTSASITTSGTASFTGTGTLSGHSQTAVDRFIANTPMYVAHRGGSADWVEETMYAYDNAIAWNSTTMALEVSVWKTSDNVWVCSHDQTTGRVFGTNYDIPTTSWATMSGLTTTTGGYPILRLDTLLNKYATPDRVWFIDNKGQQTPSAFLSFLATYGGPANFISKGYCQSTTMADAATAAGYQTWGYFYDADVATSATYQTHWTLLGQDVVSLTNITADWTTMKSYGKPVLAHIVANTTQKATGVTQGASGFVASGVTEVVPQAVIPTLLSSTGTLVGTGVANFQATATFTGSGTLVGTGVATINATGTANFASTGTLTASSSIGVAGTATFASTGTLTTSATPTITQTANFTSTGTLVGTGAGAQPGSGTANFSGSGTLTAQGSVSTSDSAAFSSTGTLTGSGIASYKQTANFTGAGILVGTGIPSQTSSGNANLTGSGTLVATGVASITGVATFLGAGELTAIGSAIITGIANFAGSGQLEGSSTSGYRDVVVQIEFDEQRWVTDFIEVNYTLRLEEQ